MLALSKNMVALSPPLKAEAGLNGRRVAEPAFLQAPEGVSANVVYDIRKATQQAMLGINQWWIWRCNVLLNLQL